MDPEITNKLDCVSEILKQAYISNWSEESLRKLIYTAPELLSEIRTMVTDFKNVDHLQRPVECL